MALSKGFPTFTFTQNTHTLFVQMGGVGENAMAFQPVPDCAEVAMRYIAGDELAVNTLSFNKTGSGTITLSDIMGLAAAMANWHATFLYTLQSSAVLLTEVYVRALNEENDYVWNESTDTTGDLTSPIMPGNVTGTVTFRTNRAGRSARGRNYVVGLTESQCVGNSLVLGVSDDYVAAYEEMNDLALAAGWTHVVVSRFFDEEPRESGIFFPVVNYTMDPDLDSQRRRLRGRGA